MSKILSKFSFFAYPFIIEKMQSENVSISELSRRTNVSQNVLENILKDEDSFVVATFRNIFALFDALSIDPDDIIEDYFRQMYSLDEDDCNVIAVLNVIEGAKHFSLSEEDFDLAVQFLERLSSKTTSDF